MTFLAASIGLLLVLGILLDAFEVVLLPRPVRRRLRVNQAYYRLSWTAWAWLARRLAPGRRREDFVGAFGPLSMVLLFALWAASLIVGFGLLHWAWQQFTGGTPHGTLASAMVVSGDAFFTLGYGDVVPHNLAARMLVIVEAGTGFGFIALTIAYLPVVYQHFARRDFQLIEFSTRAGSPPTAEGLLRWHAAGGGAEPLAAWLRSWEIWASDLIESHAAYPMLAFYRSQHEGQSWLAALTVVLDTCALVVAGAKHGAPVQAAATFAAARRALAVVAGSLGQGGAAAPERPWQPDIPARFEPIMRPMLPDWKADADMADALATLRAAYEPALGVLSAYLMLPLPAWLGADGGTWAAGTRAQRVAHLAGAPRAGD